MDSRIKLLDRLRIQLKGHIYLGVETKTGWKEPAPLYMFKCPIHGYVKSTIKGHARLECPECIKELKKMTV
jgi:hypothetical protein